MTLPHHNTRLDSKERASLLLSRLSLEDKVGLMFHTVIESGPGGTLVETVGALSKSATSTVVLEKRMNHFNVHGLGTPREAARWANALQALAAQTEHAIPVTISTDPRHAFTENAGASFAARGFSQWPEPLGLAALEDADILEHAQIARKEYRAVGISMALHPQVDLASDPRWGRQFQTFGADANRTIRALLAYLNGFQGPQIDAASVACVTKHFPGAGPQQGGEDAHFPYGREQVYPGEQFDLHLAPFEAAIEAGAAGMMPYYGMPMSLVVDGEPVEPVGFAFNRQIVTRLLREKLGFEGIVVTDWELIHDNVAQGQVLPAKAWGVEHLTPAERMIKVIEAGCDQFGGEECTDLLLDLVRTGHVAERRIDQSALRLLELKFRLGLFDDPFVDEDEAAEIVGCAAHNDAGFRAQAASVTVLADGGVGGSSPLLPLTDGHSTRIYVEGMSKHAAQTLGTVVDRPEDADVAVVRLAAPYEPRNDLLFESLFHQGSLEYRPGLLSRLRAIATTTRLVVDANLERPAILAPVVEIADAVVGTYGVSDDALAAALTGRIHPRGRLPFEIPSSTVAVENSPEDVPNSTDNPLFPAGFRVEVTSR